MKVHISKTILHLECALLLAICLFRSIKIQDIPIFGFFVLLFSVSIFLRTKITKELIKENLAILIFLFLNFLLLIFHKTSFTYIGHSILLPVFLISLFEFFKDSGTWEVFEKYIYYSIRVVFLIMFIPFLVYSLSNFEMILDYIYNYNNFSSWKERSQIIIHMTPFFVGSSSATIEIVFFIMAGSLVEFFSNRKKATFVTIVLMTILRARSLFVSLIAAVAVKVLAQFKSLSTNISILTTLLAFPIAIYFLPVRFLSGRHLGKEVFLKELNLLPNGLGYSAKVLENYSSNPLYNKFGYPVMRVFDNIHYELITDYGIILYICFIAYILYKLNKNSNVLYSPLPIFFFVTMSCSFGSNFYPMYIFMIMFLPYAGCSDSKRFSY